MIKRFLFAAGMALASASGAQAFVEYQCFNRGGPLIYATLFDEEDVVQVLFFNEETGAENEYLLTPAVSGSGFRYSDGQIDFTGQGQRTATITVGGASANCEVINIVEPGDNISPPVSNPEFAGFSFGGNLRQGPGVDRAVVGNTFNGQQLTLLRDSGVSFNGYNFWAIRTPNGQEAFQWGGILCSPGNELTGIFNDGC